MGLCMSKEQQEEQWKKNYRQKLQQREERRKDRRRTKREIENQVLRDWCQGEMYLERRDISPNCCCCFNAGY